MSKMFKIDKRIKKTFEKIKEKNKQFSFLWLNQDEFWIQYPKIKKKFKLKFIIFYISIIKAKIF